MKTISKCPVCNSPVYYSIKNEINFHYVHDDIFKIQLEGYLDAQKPGRESCFNIRICTACQLLYKEPFFSDSELENIYRHEYPSQESQISQKTGYVYNNAFFLQTCANHASKIVNKIITDEKTGIKKIFDIGGRDGFRMVNLAHDSFDCVVFDPIPIIPCNPAIKKEYVFLEDIDASKHSADLILLCNILEHCKKPQEVILKCRNLLNDNGYLFIQVPFDIPQIIEWILAGKIQKRNLLIDITHVLFFSLDSLKYLIENQGFICISAEIDSLPIIENKSNVLVINVLARRTNAHIKPSKKLVKHFSLFNSKLIKSGKDRVLNNFLNNFSATKIR